MTDKENGTLTVPNESVVQITDANPWRIRLQGLVQVGPDGVRKKVQIEGLECDNYVVDRSDGKFFLNTMVETKGFNKDGDEVKYRLPRNFEIGDGQKCGDVIVQFRKHPKTGRWFVDVEPEFISNDVDEQEIVPRLKRASLDNLVKLFKKTVKKSGEEFLNSQRGGGDPVFTHAVVANWSPQFYGEGKLMDVFDFVQGTLDAPGKATILNSLQALQPEYAEQIALHIIHAPQVD